MWQTALSGRRTGLGGCRFAEDGRFGFVVLPEMAAAGPHIAATCGKRPRSDDARGREVRRFSEDGRSGFAPCRRWPLWALVLRPHAANGREAQMRATGRGQRRGPAG